MQESSQLIDIFKMWWYVWVLLIVFGLYKWFIPEIRGYFGEKLVKLYLNKLDKTKYLVINNIMLQIGDKTTQIDHVVISNYGIFSIETKNYRGWIIGNEFDDYWKQIIFKRKERLRNPIKQNWGHIQALKEIFSGYPNIKYYSIVTFTPRANLKVKTTSDVIYTSQLLNTIKKYDSECITDALKEQLCSQLTSLNVNNKVNRKAHVKTIRNTLNEKKNLINKNICPKCGGQLVVRNGKYGQFKGCNNYPKCKFILKE